MADWTVTEREWTPDRLYEPFGCGYYQEKPALAQCFTPQAQHYLSPPSPTLTLLLSHTQKRSPTPCAQTCNNQDLTVIPRGENPRELRNKAEKQRRDRLNQSISQLASVVPPVVASNRKVDKTSVLRLAAHYLRSHNHVFGDSVVHTAPNFKTTSAQTVLGLLKGFLLTITYKGIVVVVSQNVQQFLGYSELDLLGQNILSIVHPNDQQTVREYIMPKSQLLGGNGELIVPEGSEERERLAEELARDKRRFTVRFRKLRQRTEPCQYVTCVVEGSLRKSDGACHSYSKGCQLVRRARARGDHVISSGNDVVFIGVARPTSETFLSETSIETFKMEYRTRHSVDGEIIQCDQRIALVTGYMTHEVNGINAMNFMHRDDVRWVIIALREMYDENRVFGESCYRLMTKCGEFIYMRTRGQLDVDGDSRAVRSFVCTNTLVDEQEGKHLIKVMKKKFMLMVNNREGSAPEETVKEKSDNQEVPIEDPRQLEKVILHLVTNLPSPQPCNSVGHSFDNRDLNSLPLSIIPPRKERIVSAIEKIYSVVRLTKECSKKEENKEDMDYTSKDELDSSTALIAGDSAVNYMSPPPTYTEAMHIAAATSNHEYLYASNADQNILTPVTYQPPNYQPPSYQPSSYQPPSYEPPSYQPPSYQPPSYQPPSYQPPSYQPPIYQTPVYAPVTFDIIPNVYLQHNNNFYVSSRNAGPFHMSTRIIKPIPVYPYEVSATRQFEESTNAYLYEAAPSGSHQENNGTKYEEATDQLLQGSPELPPTLETSNGDERSSSAASSIDEENKPLQVDFTLDPAAAHLVTVVTTKGVSEEVIKSHFADLLNPKRQANVHFDEEDMSTGSPFYETSENSDLNKDIPEVPFDDGPIDIDEIMPMDLSPQSVDIEF